MSNYKNKIIIYIIILLIILWLSLVFHYYFTLYTYTEQNLHLKNPQLYLATENYFLFSLTIFTFLILFLLSKLEKM